MLMGHQAGLGQDVSYFRGSNLKELAEYMKVVESLTINQENKLSKKLQGKDNVIYVQLKEKDERINKLWKVVKESRESNEAWRMHTFNALQGVIKMKGDENKRKDEEINKLKRKIEK
ncbi:MAG: hypothetical protein WCB31_06690 [Nitrososphaeraceae archaeon]